MNPKPYREILDSVAADHMPAGLSLYPRIAAQLERKPFMQTLRARPLVALVIMILALLLLSGVAYAVGSLLGYIPGVGVIDRSAPIRVLAAPAGQTRDGVTVTVKQAVLSADKSVLSVEVQGVPSSAYPKDEASIGCYGRADLILADGTLLEGGGIMGGNWTAFESRLEYGPLPAGAMAAVLLLECIGGTRPGALPEDWRIPLTFMPAPPDMMIVPVIDVATPVPTPASAPSVSQVMSDPFLGVTLHLESMTRTERGYILVTSIHWDARIANSVGTDPAQSVSLTDAAGKKIELLQISDNFPASTAPHSSVLAFSMADVPFKAPLTLTLASAGINPVEQPRFSFDPGRDPQPGQAWPLNQEIQVLGFPLRVASARFVLREEIENERWARTIPRDMNGFEFTLTGDAAVRALYLTVESGLPPNASSASGSSGRDTAGRLNSSVFLSGEIAAPLTIAATYMQIDHPWSIQWDPAAVVTSAAPVTDTPSLSASLQVEKVIPTDDGYYLIGRTRWSDPRFLHIELGGWGGLDARLLAANGDEFVIEPAGFNDIGINEPEPGQWIYKVYGKAFPASLTLRMTRAQVGFTQPYTLAFDPGPDPQLGQEWQIDQTLDILGRKVTVRSATFIHEYNSYGFMVELVTDPELYDVQLGIESGVSGAQGGGGGASPRQEDGSMNVYVFSDGTFGGPLTLGISSATLAGSWETSWNPPAAEPGATPVAPPQSCVPQEEWDRPAGDPAGSVAEVAGKFLLRRGALSPDPTQFIVNPDGSDEKGLTFGLGSLSPDGAQFVYASYLDNRLYVMELAGRQSTPLTSGPYDWEPHWSPDGNWIAFHRNTDTSRDIFVVDAQGRGEPRRLADTTNAYIAGWTPDSRKILVSINNSSPDDPGVAARLVDLSGGETKTLLANAEMPAISPDGEWLAYGDKVIGKMDPGIYISRLDGSEKRLIAQDNGAIPIWSPDGKWLAVSTGSNDFLQPESVPALINLETCRVIRMPWLVGAVHAWMRP